MPYLLVIACSKRKILAEAPVPAMELYDGVSYRLIRKLRRDQKLPNCLHLKIISAKYGLIDANQPIVSYERRLTSKEIGIMAPALVCSFQSAVRSTPYDEIYFDLGKNYLAPFLDIIPTLRCRTITASGRIGVRLQNLKKWITSLSDKESQHVSIESTAI